MTTAHYILIKLPPDTDEDVESLADQLCDMLGDADVNDVAVVYPLAPETIAHLESTT